MTNPVPPGAPQGNYGPQGAPQGNFGAQTPPPGGFPPPPGGFPTPPAPKKRGGSVRIVLGAVALVVVIVIAVVGYFANKSDPDAAKVGSCMQGQSENDLKTVSCAKTYDWKVVGKINDRSQSEFETAGDDNCKDYPTATAYFWKGEKNGNGYVLCLEPKS